MIRLLQIELNKLRNYRAFWVLIGMYFVGLAGTLLSIQGVFNAFLDDNVPSAMRGGFRWDFYSLPEGWHYMSWIASLFNFLLPIVVVIIVSSEFSNKTIRQNIINGMSRGEWLTGKLLLMAFIALLSTLVLFMVTLVLGLFHSDLESFGDLFSKVGYVPGYFLQTTGYLVFAMLMSIIIRNTGVTIGILSIYSLFMERVIYMQFPDGAETYFPLRSFNNLVLAPFGSFADANAPVIAPLDLVVSITYMCLFGGLAYLILKRRDL